jgi:hypothetical protein
MYLTLKLVKRTLGAGGSCLASRILATWEIDQEDHGLRPAWVNSLQYSISKISRAKWTGGVAQAVEYLLCNCEFIPQSHQNKQQKNQIYDCSF